MKKYRFSGTGGAIMHVEKYDNLKFFLETRHTDLGVSDIDGNMVAGIGYFIWRNRRLFREGIGFRVNDVPEDIIDIIHKDE